jgi:hypothetical protein
MESTFSSSELMQIREIISTPFRHQKKVVEKHENVAIINKNIL